MSFPELRTTKKGKAGEVIVRRYLARRGVLTYSPDFIGSHPCDFVGFSKKESGGPWSLFFADAKTYPRQYRFARTGIDYPDWIKYQRLAEHHGTPFVLFFVDVFERAIYGATIAQLAEVVEINHRDNKAYFPLCRVTHLAELTDRDLRQLEPIKEPERYRCTSRFFSVT